MKRQICSILLFIFCVTLQAQLVTYPEGLKANMPHNDDYTVRVRIQVNGKICLNIMYR